MLILGVHPKAASRGHSKTGQSRGAVQSDLIVERAKIKAREAKRQTQEQVEYQEMVADRDRIAEKELPHDRGAEGGRSSGGSTELTDPESRIMPISQRFVLAYSAALSQRPTDRRLLKPMLRTLCRAAGRQAA